ncbi:facilitated trehalose transporter Tret1-like [Maniola hyperantus]|uniref:facilitated trehalose transporter Tret1-like n=1 Tax=Aphantopus hyperantus TaxID=2795564 RepID=UPI001568B1AA|nr:facilitated trehalose transporter Tret1-like [Maniola hyperantus]
MKSNLIQINGRTRQVLIATCMYLGQLVVGFSVAWSGVILPKLRDSGQSPLNELPTETQLSLVASILYVGCIPGPYISGWLSNIKGRKPCQFFGGVITSLSLLILALSTNLAMLLCTRVLCGIGLGIIAVTNLVYIGEMASTNIRGTLLTILGIFHTIGAIILYTASHFFSYSGTNYVGLACCIAFTLTSLLIPESPIFHVLEGNDAAVIKTLNELGRSEDIDKILVAKKEFQDTTAKKDWIELFSLRGNRKALIIVLTISVFQHCSGVMVVVFFAGTIFEIAGSTMESNISMLIIAAFQMIGSFIGPFVVERSGRKVLLVVSSCICSLAMFFLGLYFYLDHVGNPVIDKIKWFPLAVLILFFIGYDSGLGIIPNTLIGEMFTTNVRSKGSAVALTSSWAAGFVVTTIFGSIIESIGYIAFWIFAATCLGAVVFTIFCVLETKGKSLLEIQDLLSKK